MSKKLTAVFIAINLHNVFCLRKISLCSYVTIVAGKHNYVPICKSK